jgi:GTP-binding protein Era
MLDYVHHSLIDTDVVLFLMDVEDDPKGQKTLESLKEPEEDDEEENKLRKILTKRRKAKSSYNFLVLNKVDKSNQDTLNSIVDKFREEDLFDEIIPVSAQLNFNVDVLLDQILEKLPVHPKYYPDDQLSDANERFFVSEIIREQIFELYQEEVPYSTEVLIEEFKEQEGKKDYISAAIVVEKNSQKPIIIGKQGKAIKKLGSVAREEIEDFLQRPVFLEIRVKVREKWRSKDNFLKSYGYSVDD